VIGCFKSKNAKQPRTISGVVIIACGVSAGGFAWLYFNRLTTA